MAKRPGNPVSTAKKRQTITLSIGLSVFVLACAGGGFAWYLRRPPTEKQRLRLGQQFASQGRGAMAMVEYRAAAAMDKTDPAPYLGMSDLEQTGGNLSAAADLLGTVLHYNPHYPHVQCRRAQLYGMANRFETAYITAQDAITVEPNCPAAHNGMGMLLEISDNVSGAAIELGKAHSLAPDDEALTLDYARVLAKSGKPNDALQIVQTVLPVTRLYRVQANYLAGWILSEYGMGGHLDFDTAQGYLGKALMENPNHTASLAQSGHIFLREGKYIAAQLELEKAFKKGPDTIEMLNDLVSVYRAQNDSKLAEAIQTSKQLSEMITPLKSLRQEYVRHPEDKDNLVKLARAEAGAGNVVDAFDLIKQVHDLEPKRKDAADLYNQMKNPAASQSNHAISTAPIGTGSHK